MKLKVCGLKHMENIIQVATLHPDYMGFIFYPESKRFVGNDFKMPSISPAIKKIGVFVSQKADDIIEKTDKYGLNFIQLHGNESPSFCEVMSHLVKVIKAFGIDDNFDFNVLEKYKSCCDYFLFDTKTAEYGGSGKQFNWNVLEKYTLDVPFFISGGIGLEEVEKLKIEKFNIHAIDVNSRFEVEPGLKDIIKLEKLNIKMQD